MGYYPTSTTVLCAIESHLDRRELGYSNQPILFDPSCGNGEARLFDGYTTTGIELDHARALLAEQNMKVFVKGDAFSSSISEGCVSVLFLNPPYDDGPGGKRLEYLFLKRFTPSLQRGGILAYIIPQKRLRGDIADYLASHYENIRVYEYPDTEFGQVVLLANRRQRALSKALAHDEAARLSMYGYDRENPQALNRLSYYDEKPYKVLPRPSEFEDKINDEGKSITGFTLKTKTVDLNKLYELIKNDGATARANARLNEVSQESALMGRPPLPFHSGHLGLLMCSGFLDGVIGEGDEKHLIKGKVTKVYNTRKDYDDKGDLVEMTSESYSVNLKMLLPNGDLKILSGARDEDENEDQVETQDQKLVETHPNSAVAHESFKTSIPTPKAWTLKELMGEEGSDIYNDLRSPPDYSTSVA